MCVLLCLARIGQALKREKAECGALPGAAIGDDVTFLFKFDLQELSVKLKKLNMTSFCQKKTVHLNLAISLEYSSQLILVGAIIKIENCERVRLFATTAAATATVRA